MNNAKKTDRSIAIVVLSEVLDNSAFANIALRKALAETELDARSRAFVTELVNETLRNLLHIDYIVNTFSKTHTDKMKPFIRNLLRISVCQLRKMEKIPAHAAINEAVALTRAHGFQNLTGFVNGVLRSVDREKDKPYISSANLALQFSYPKWLIKSISTWLGDAQVRNFCEYSHMPPPVIVFINTAKTSSQKLVHDLQAEGVDTETISDSNKNFLMLRQPGDISKLQTFQNGHFFVIDPGAFLAVNMLTSWNNSEENRLPSNEQMANEQMTTHPLMHYSVNIEQPIPTIIDMCAAPGGKSFAIACAMQNKCRILSQDIHPHRIELIRQTAKRLGLTAVTPTLQDATVLNPSLIESADAVLLDAPCSGFGTIRKHPEIKYTRTKSDVQTLAKIQEKMLQTAAHYVKLGGTLVYCTCTIATEENMNNITKFLTAHPNFSLANATQILPSKTQDGFFAAKLIKSAH